MDVPCPLFSFVILDFEGSDWMFRKAQEVEALLAHNLASYETDLLPPDELQNILMDKFYLQRMNIEVLGRNDRFDECQYMIEKQSELLSDMDPSTLKKYPTLTAIHWEQMLLVDRANNHKNSYRDEDTFIGSTPEVVSALGRLSLNPSGKFVK